MSAYNKFLIKWGKTGNVWSISEKKKSFIFWWIKQESDGTITLLPTMRWTYSLSCNNLTVWEPTVSFLKGNVLFILNVASFIPLFSARLIDVYWTESKALEFRVWLCLIWINIYLNFRIFISHRYTFFPKCFGKWDWDRDIKEQGLNIFFFWGCGGGQELSNLLTHYSSLSCSYSFICLGMYIRNMDRKRKKEKKKNSCLKICSFIKILIKITTKIICNI